MKTLKTSHIVLFLLALVLVFFWPFFLGKTVLFGDNYSLMVPGKLFTVEWLRQGIVPLWNPTIFAGVPWIGDINQSILYPSTLFFLVMPAFAAVNLTVAAHVLLTSVGMYFLARRLQCKQEYALIAAILWTFSPQIIGSINNLSTIQSLSWMPWVVFAGVSIRQTKFLLLFPLFVFIQMLGGYPQHVLYSVLTAGLFSLFEQWQFRSTDWMKWTGTWIVAGVLSLLLTSVVIFPFVPTLLDSTRTIQTEGQAAAGSLEFAELIKIAIPQFFDNPSQGIKWGVSWSKPPNLMVYFGWLGLTALAGYVFLKKKNPTDWLYASVIGVSILIALGDNLPLFGALQQLSIFRYSRGLSTILMVTTLVGSIWIATLLPRIKASVLDNRKLRSILLVIASTTLIGLIVSNWKFFEIWKFADSLIGSKLSLSQFHTPERDQLIALMIFGSVFLNSILLLISLWLWKTKRWILLLIVVFLDMSLNTKMYIRFAPATVYTTSKPANIVDIQDQLDLDFYRVLTRNYNTQYTEFGSYWDAITVRKPFSDSYVDEQELRNFNHLLRMRNGATPNWNMVYGIPIINGYTTLLPQSTHTLFAQGREDASINNLPTLLTTEPILQQWSVKYYLVDTWFPEYDEVFPKKVIYHQGDWKVYELPDVLPRFRIENGAAQEILVQKETPNLISLEVKNASESSSLLVADRYDANWQAEVNNQQVAIDNSNGMRSIPLFAGDNQVTMRYQPKEFYRGAFVSLITLAGMALYTLVKRRELFSR